MDEKQKLKLLLDHNLSIQALIDHGNWDKLSELMNTNSFIETTQSMVMMEHSIISLLRLTSSYKSKIPNWVNYRNLAVVEFKLRNHNIDDMFRGLLEYTGKEEKRFYTGVGSRETPNDILEMMCNIAMVLSGKGFTLRSGGAGGSDKAFGNGSTDSDIYLPWENFNYIKNGIVVEGEQQQKAREIASKVHPAWDKCSNGAKKLHTRNVFQVLGVGLDTPSEFLICWTINGKLVGGTATAMRLANMYDVPIYNLALEDDRLTIQEIIKNIKNNNFKEI